MEFTKYMHLEKLGSAEVEGIEFGTCFVFPKLDGTNASVWLQDGKIQAGSRNRHLSIESDNAGFCAWAEASPALLSYLEENPSHILYGEWLVPHSLKTYADDAWNRFYVFDVFSAVYGGFMPYASYNEALAKHGLDYISPIATVKNGNQDTFLKSLDRNTFMIKDGMGVGEGVVIKNYEWSNKYGRVTWAKLITNSFREKHAKEMGVAEIGGEIIEEKIVKEFVTKHGVDKVYAKIVNSEGVWQSKLIPRLLGEVWHDLITEEMWDILKRYKNPKIDFSGLHRFTQIKVKELRPDIF